MNKNTPLLPQKNDNVSDFNAPKKDNRKTIAKGKKIKIAISGDGAMGKKILEQTLTSDFETVGVVGQNSGSFLSFCDLPVLPQCVVDFSHTEQTYKAAKYCFVNKIPLVVGTTDLSEKTLAAIKETSAVAAVCVSANFSVGISVFKKALKAVLPSLKNFDAELIECHRRDKKDSPSGTAKNVLKILTDFYGGKVATDRSGKRKSGDVGLSVMRGGDVAGRHDLYFLGDGESFVLSHVATDKKIFAAGALKAAKLLINKPSGLYDFDLLTESDKI